MNKLTIKGMHCTACTKLISLELSDIGTDQYIDRFDVGANNVGTVFLKDGVSQEDIVRMIECINAMEGYEASVE